MIPLYFIAWFCLDDKAGEDIASLADSQPMKHFRTVDFKKKLYRNTEDAKFLGVCAGVADYLEVNVFAVRILFLASAFFAGLPLFLYFAAYFILEEKPRSKKRDTAREHRRRHNRDSIKNAVKSGVRTGMAAGMEAVKNVSDKVGDAEDEHDEFEEDDVEEQLYETSTYSKRREFKYCARKFATLQGRLIRMEAYVTSNQFRLHREFKNI